MAGTSPALHADTCFAHLASTDQCKSTAVVQADLNVQSFFTLLAYLRLRVTTYGNITTNKRFETIRFKCPLTMTLHLDSKTKIEK